MNKKLLMAAIGAALVAGPMMAAQAAPTVYGRFHLSLDSVDNDAGNERGYLSSNTSRFGIKGDEDLGGGLKAIYQMETSFSADEGGGTLAGRNTFVGFTGAFGTAKAGRHDTPYKELGYKVNRFIEQVGDARNMLGIGSICDVSAAVLAGNVGTYTACDSRAGFDARSDNMLRYDSPMFGGAKVSVLHSNNTTDSAATAAASDDTGAATTGRALTSVAGTWQSGPLFLGAGYEKHQKPELGTGTTDSETGIRLVGDYALGDLTLGLLYEQVSDIDGVSDLDRSVWGIAAAYKLGNNTFKAHWFNSDDLDCPSTLTCDGTDTSMIAIGVDHAFSKTTMVYLNYAKADSGDNMVIDVANGYTGHGEQFAKVQAGKSPSAISAGVMVAF
jgi:predicted porin